MSRPLPLGGVSVKCHSACDLMSGLEQPFYLRSGVEMKAEDAHMQNMLHKCAPCTLHSVQLPIEGQICLIIADYYTTQALAEGVYFIYTSEFTNAGKLKSSHLTDVDAVSILIQKDQTDTPQSPSRLCSCSQDLLIHFP